MPPNSQFTVTNKLGDDDDQTKEIEKFSDHFWSCDLKGMENLMEYVKNAYDELDKLHEIYVARAKLEHEFGEKLQQIAALSSTSFNLNDDTDNNEMDTVQKGVPGSITAVHKELYKSAQSHFDFSRRLQEGIAEENQAWTMKQRGALKKINDSLMALYEERQDIIGELYHVREVYQELDKNSPKRQTLQNDYRLLLNKTDSILKQWNTNWMDACNQIEQLEQARMDFFTTNVWDYANLASARLMVQDEWCESIRTQLETCTFEEERERCIRQAGVGKLVPTTSDYVTYFFSSQKGTHQQEPTTSRHIKTSTEPISKSLPSKPTPTPPQKDEDISPLPPPSIRRKPVDQSSFKDKKVSAPMALEELLKKFEKKENGKQQPRSARESMIGTLPRYSQQTSSPPTTRSIAATRNDDYCQDITEKDSRNGNDSKVVSQQSNSNDECNRSTTKQTTPPSTTGKTKPNVQSDRESTMNNQTSKPPKPSLHETSIIPAEPQAKSTVDSQYHTSPPFGQLKSTAPVPPKSPRPQPQQITASTSNDFSTSSPSPSSQNESLSSGSSRPMNIPPPINTSYNNQQHQQQVPKSPIQQHISASPNLIQQQQHIPSNMMMHSPMISNTGNGATSPSPMLYPSSPSLNNGYHQVPNSPLMSGQQQPMYHHHQPPSSPMMQNQHASYPSHPQHQMQAPLRSPNMMSAVPPRSPTLASMGSQTAPPLSSPGTPAWNHPHQTMIQHSPAISRSTSPFLSHPSTTNQQQTSTIPRPHSPCIQRPTMLPDGTEILFWCQAMYDYTAQDPVELTFKAHTFFAVLYVAADGWWDGYSFDGHYFGISGSIPSNYMRRL